MGRTVEQIFKSSYYVGRDYKRFKILIVTEGGPNFSASTSANTVAFREYLHKYAQWILDAFDAAAKEVGISLGRSERAEFFTSYNYYWCNTRRSEIQSDEKIYPKIYLSSLVEELNAGLVISAGGVGDERFRKNEELPRRDILELPIYVATRDTEYLKEIFKIYLRNCRSGIDEAFDQLGAQIAKGKSPFDVAEEILENANGSIGSGGGSFNTYPMGNPSGFHSDLFIVCEDPMNLAELYNSWRWRHGGAFDYIDWWCHETEGMFPRRRVVLLTDKWTTEAYKRYENLFRRLAKKHGVKFEFYLYMLGAPPTKIKLPF